MLDKRCPWCGGLIDYQKLSWKERSANGEFPFYQNVCPHCGREYCFRHDTWDQVPKMKNITYRHMPLGMLIGLYIVCLLIGIFAREWKQVVLSLGVGILFFLLWLLIAKSRRPTFLPCRKSPTDEEQSREPGYSCTAAFTWNNGADVDSYGKPYIFDYSIIPICLLDSDGKPASRIWCIVCDRVKQPKGRRQEISFHFVLPEAPKDQLRVGGRFVAFNHENPAAEGEILRVESYY